MVVVVDETTVFFTPLGLIVLVVLPLTTIFCFVLFTVVAALFTGTAFGPAPMAFFKVAPREGFVMIVPLLEDTLLCSDMLDRMEACEAVR